jgi:hypothetical protein
MADLPRHVCVHASPIEDVHILTHFLGFLSCSDSCVAAFFLVRFQSLLTTPQLVELQLCASPV